MHWATLGLFVDFLIRLVAGPGPSPLAQLARIPVVRMKPQLTYGKEICTLAQMLCFSLYLMLCFFWIFALCQPGNAVHVKLTHHVWVEVSACTDSAPHIDASNAGGLVKLQILVQFGFCPHTLWKV